MQERQRNRIKPRRRDDKIRIIQRRMWIVLFGLYLMLAIAFGVHLIGEAKEIYEKNAPESERQTEEEPDGDVLDDVNEQIKKTDSSAHPEKKSLDLEIIYQRPEYPNGCEAVALNNLLRYYGYQISNEELINGYLPQGPLHESNPKAAYLGNPAEELGGYGCWAPVIQKTAEKYFQKQGITGMAAKDITGTWADQLYAYVEAGTPVQVWVTLQMQETGWFKAGNVNGRTVYWPTREHAVVLTGYDLERGIVEVNDPLEGKVEYLMDAFERAYESMGKNAIVLELVAD